MNFCSVIESWCFSYFILYFRLLHMGNHSYLVLLVFSWPESPITAVLFRFLSEILWLQDLLLQLKINKFNFLKKDHLYLPKKLTLKLIFVTHSIFSHKIYALSSKFHLASISPWASLVAQLVKNLPAMQDPLNSPYLYFFVWNFFLIFFFSEATPKSFPHPLLKLYIS